MTLTKFMCHVTPRVSVYFFLIFGLQHCFYFYLPHFFFTFDLKKTAFFCRDISIFRCLLVKKKKKKVTLKKKNAHLPHVYRTCPHVRSCGGFTARAVVPCGITALNPVYMSRVDPSVLVFCLSLHPPPLICIHDLSWLEPCC